METEVDRLNDEAKVLDRDWRRIPFLAAVALFGVPAYYIWGPGAAIFAVVLAPCLVVTALYLIGVRRYENKQNIEELRRQLDVSK
jgi:hypothetical protein